ncbi:MAG: trypsin-like serine protease [Myxococcota bacterium]|nr:trypsin-like serine protease [Myxococcota bacterium]MDW8363260.1 trypsin-like serine protease [Myxococcales bacterium]
MWPVTRLLMVVAIGCTGRVGPTGLSHAPPRPDAGVIPMPDGGGQSPDDAARPDARTDGGVTRDECGDLRTLAPVFHGTLRPTAVPMSEGEILAVAMVSVGGGLCSGALIAPRWVLTASHCTGGSASSTVVSFGRDPARPDIRLGARRLVDHPSVDMALVELDRDATAAIPGIVPVRILTERMDRSWIGRTAEAAGYGQTERGDTGTRYFTAEPIVDVSSTLLTIDGQGRRGVCFGDSGGPVFVTASDGSVRVAGALSFGDPSCVGRDNFSRTDAQRSWIEGFTGPTPEGPGPEPPVPCEMLGMTGRCERDIARWCEGGSVRMRDCGACGQSCVFDVAAGGAVCR